MLQKLNYKNNDFDFRILGNFKDARDSMFYISTNESWHITFVKVDGKLEEWIRKVVVVQGMDDLFISEVEFKYASNYKSISGARSFIKKQKNYDDYKSFIYDYLRQTFRFGNAFSDSSRFSFDVDDTPF